MIDELFNLSTLQLINSYFVFSGNFISFASLWKDLADCNHGKKC